MNQQQELFNDCLRFWQRLGVEKEENLNALASYDMVFAYKDKVDQRYNNPELIEKAKQIHKTLSDSKYNNNRGGTGWLKGLGY
jgi:hypothetical protein